MTSVLELDLRVRAARRVSTVLSRGGFSIVGKLRGSGRADVSICLPEGARRIDDLVVLRALALAEGPDAPSGALPVELELAASIYHDNIVRTLGTGWEAGRPFIVSEYLEGTTLRRLLRWLGSRGQRLANPELSRILVAIIAAVEHADRSVKKPHARALVHHVISADDVFVTYSGDVKLLGFKPPRPRAEDERAQPGEDAALDALLSTQQSPELAAVLATIGARVSATSILGLWQSVQTLLAWQTELGTDGRNELAAVMSAVMPEGRASRRAQLEAACARALRARQLTAERGALSDDAPVSGYRVREVASRDVLPPPLPRIEVDAAILPPPLPPSKLEVTVTPWPSVTVDTTITRSPFPWVEAPLIELPASPSAAPGGPLEAVSLEAVPQGEPSPFAQFAFSRARRGWLPWVLAGVPLLCLAVAFAVHADVRAASRTVEVTTAALRPAVPGEPSPVSSNAAPGAVRATPPAEARRGRWKDGDRPLGSPARTAASVRQAPGYLTLDTTPPSSVTLGTRDLGATPLRQLELPAGSHVLELRNEKLGIAASVVVNVPSGQTAQRHIELEPSVR